MGKNQRQALGTAGPCTHARVSLKVLSGGPPSRDVSLHGRHTQAGTAHSRQAPNTNLKQATAVMRLLTVYADGTLTMFQILL